MNSTLESVVQHWLSWVVPATWQVAFLVIIIALLTTALRKTSPRLRYTLWLLVLIKIFLPPSLAISWSAGDWGVRPLWNLLQPKTQQFLDIESSVRATTSVVTETDTNTTQALGKNSSPSSVSLSSASVIFLIWIMGGLSFFGFVVWQYRQVAKAVSRMPIIEEGPLRVRLESISIQLGLKQIPQLCLSDRIASPFLFGIMQPRIVLPQQMIKELNETELDSVLLHELSHWRRRDTWIGWLQVVGQSLFWFHPLVWWANARLRHERECVCDETVLRTGTCDPADYGQALLGVLSAARGRSLVQGSLVGVFEPGGNIQNRLEEIMNYEPNKREFGFWSRTMVVALAVLLLPMAIPALSADKGDVATEDQSNKELRQLPWIVKTSPAVGATDVDPNLSEISVTFDRDMANTGYSWTGNEETFMPPILKETKPKWLDNRTCVLPVKLEEGQYYRVGINSSSFRNFKSKQGQAAPSSVIYFVTQGASKAMQGRVRVPKMIKLTPENGTKDVDPKTNRLVVAFDMPMGEGMSWTGGGEDFPEVNGSDKPKWVRGGKACVLPVKLKPGKSYRLGINSFSHNNFQSKWGVPVDAVVYEFKTRE